MNMQKYSVLGKYLIYLVAITFSFFAIYPLIWLLLQSFKTTQEYLINSKLALPQNWFLGNFPQTWRMGKFNILLSNSLFYSLVTVTTVVVLSCMASFAFAKLRFKITPLLHGVFIIGILLTVQSIMIPLFLMAAATGLYNTRLGVLIPYIGLGLPMGIYLCTEFIKHIPDELIESARIDGAGYFKIFYIIVFPICTPVAITLAILTFTAAWNEYVLVLILTSRDAIRSVPVGIARFSGALGTDYGKQFSGLVIGVIPILIFYGIFRKQITKGVVAGAVKG